MIREIPVQVFTHNMSVARRLMRKDHPHNDDVLELDESITMVYRQRSGCLFSDPSGPGPSINFLLLLVGEVEANVVAESVVGWLGSGKVEIISFKRRIISLDNVIEAKREIEEILLN